MTLQLLGTNDRPLISPYNNTFIGHENNGSDPQIKKLLIIKHILLPTTAENVERTMWRVLNINYRVGRVNCQLKTRKSGSFAALFFFFFFFRKAITPQTESLFTLGKRQPYHVKLKKNSHLRLECTFHLSYQPKLARVAKTREWGWKTRTGNEMWIKYYKNDKIRNNLPCKSTCNVLATAWSYSRFIRIRGALGFQRVFNCIDFVWFKDYTSVSNGQ